MAASPLDGSLLAFGVDLASVRTCLLENINSHYRLAGWLALPRTDGASLAELCADACDRLGNRLGRTLWDPHTRTPLLTSEDSLRQPPLAQLSIAASPKPHVRVWLAGLTSSRSMAIAQEALAGCPAHVIGYSTFSADLQIGMLSDQLAVTTPDLVIVVGGYDNPTAETNAPLLELCRVIGQALARSAPAQRPGVIYAGNRWAAPRAVELLQAAGGSQVEAVENVQPAPEIVHRTALAQAVTFYYWRLSRRAPGFREISRWVTGPGHIASLESGFAQLVQVWMELHGLPELHGLYCAPAWWLHVWAARNQIGLNMRFVEPRTRPDALADWPPLQLVSGPWPEEVWAHPELYWWDQSGMTPLVAAVGQVQPQAMVQVLRADLLDLHQGSPS